MNEHRTRNGSIVSDFVWWNNAGTVRISAPFGDIKLRVLISPTDDFAIEVFVELI